MLEDDRTASTRKRRAWGAVLGALLLVIFALTAYQLVSQSSADKNRGLALQELPKLLPPRTKDLGSLVLANYREYRANAIRWSFAYFGCLFGSAFASASAGVVLKLDVLKSRPSLKNDAAATLAAIAALLITLSTSGDFQRKWQANRVAADAMENLSYDLLRAGTALDSNAVLDRIQAINEARTEGVAGKAKRDSDTGRRTEGEARPSETPASQKPAKPQAGPRAGDGIIAPP